MENKILLQPHPTAVSYLTHFQIARLNFELFIQEEREQKRRHRNRHAAVRAHRRALAVKD